MVHLLCLGRGGSDAGTYCPYRFISYDAFPEFIYRKEEKTFLKLSLHNREMDLLFSLGKHLSAAEDNPQSVAKRFQRLGSKECIIFSVVGAAFRVPDDDAWWLLCFCIIAAEVSPVKAPDLCSLQFCAPAVSPFALSSPLTVPR